MALQCGLDIEAVNSVLERQDDIGAALSQLAAFDAAIQGRQAAATGGTEKEHLHPDFDLTWNSHSRKSGCMLERCCRSL